MTEPKFETGDIVTYVWRSSEWTARVTAVSLVENLNQYKPLVRWDAGWRYDLVFLSDGAKMRAAPEASLRPVPNVVSLPLPRRDWQVITGGAA